MNNFVALSSYYWSWSVRHGQLAKLELLQPLRKAGALFTRRNNENFAPAEAEVGISTAINWVRRFRETGSVEPEPSRWL